MTLSVAIDLGTTHIKGAILNRSEELESILAVPAPELSGTGLIRESDAESYFAAAEDVYRKLAANVPADTPLGVASQRSSFVLFDSRTNNAVTPFISWQDRRAAALCRGLVGMQNRVTARTGLLLSPHYAGTKLASLLQKDQRLREGARDGTLLLGTADAYFLRRISTDNVHATDISVAARTLLADHKKGLWADDMLELFGVPKRILPEIYPTSGRSVRLKSGCRLTASLSDQAACALAVISHDSKDVLVNLGTGVFVLLAAGDEDAARDRYLSAPLHSDAAGRITRCVEGTVNGAGTSAAAFAGEPIEAGNADRMPDVFSIPDSSGIGSPHWNPERGLQFSRSESSMSCTDKHRAVLEGIIFRIREILDDLWIDRSGELTISGGLTREKFIAVGLASCLDRRILMLAEPEATLLGTARIAAGLSVKTPLNGSVVEPDDAMSYLRTKYGLWREWFRRVAAGT